MRKNPTAGDECQSQQDAKSPQKWSGRTRGPLRKGRRGLGAERAGARRPSGSRAKLGPLGSWSAARAAAAATGVRLRRALEAGRPSCGVTGAGCPVPCVSVPCPPPPARHQSDGRGRGHRPCFNSASYFEMCSHARGPASGLLTCLWGHGSATAGYWVQPLHAGKGSR